MTMGSRHTCERHRWVDGAWNHENAHAGRAVLRAISNFPFQGARFAGFIFICLLSVLLLGALGTLGTARANGSIVEFDGGPKVQRMRVAIDKSNTIRLQKPFAEALVGNSEIAERAVHTGAGLGKTPR